MFDWLRRQPDRTPPTNEVPKQRPEDEALRRDLAALKADVDELQRQWKRQVVEWEEWYDKYRQLYARLAKRESRASRADDPPQSPQDDPGDTISRQPVVRGAAVGLERLRANRARYGGT